MSASVVNFVKGNPLNARNLTRKPAANLMPSHSAPPLIRRAIPTGEGTFIAEYSACGLAGLDFPAATPDSVNLAGGQASSLSWTTGIQPVVSCADRRDALSSLTGGTPVFRSESIQLTVLAAPPPQLDEWHSLTIRAVHTALAGQTPTHLPPLDLTRGTPFQQCVWRELQNIAAGQTRSYGEVAAALGRPKATRAVGSACGANPLPLLVPCHRVLAAGGRLGGFSGGLPWKLRLLHAEGSAPPPRPPRHAEAHRAKNGFF